MVWFTIAIWLDGDDNYIQVYRWLLRFSKKLQPTSSALTQARAKIGVPVLADVYRTVVRTLCSEDTPDAFYAGRRLVALCEVGSRVMFDFRIKPIRCGEVAMAKQIYRGLLGKSLLLFDIGCCTFELMQKVIDRKSDFLGRAKMNAALRR